MRPTRLLIGLLPLLAVAATPAESLDMPAPEGAAEQKSLDLPAKGMSMKEVRRRYGAAQEVRPPVGEPPITRWVYEGYTVYFEHRHAIHAVPHPND